MIAVTVIGIILLAWVIVDVIFYRRSCNKLRKDILDEPVDFPSWMVCPKCPDSNFNLKPEDDQCIVECAECFTSYIVDTKNDNLTARR